MQIPKKLLLLAGIAVAVAAFSTAPLALADDGQSGADGIPASTTTDSHAPDSSVNSSSRERQEQQRRAAQKTEDTSGSEDDAAKTTVTGDTLHGRAKQLLEEKRKNKKTHTAEQIQKVCEQRKAGIEKMLATLGERATAHLNSFNTLFDKVQAYQAKNQLGVPDYDTLLAAVNEKKIAATAAVEALKGDNSTIDCAAADPATNLAVNKTAADQARTALQAYRTALKALIKAMIAAQDTNTSGDQ